MARRSPDFNYLVTKEIRERLADGTETDANMIKNVLNDEAREWYLTTHPERYPNTVNEMLYAYLLAHQGGGED